jgi:hypothetical protein
MTESIDVSTAIAEWVMEYKIARAELVAEITSREDFQRWAAAEIAAGPWDIDDCVHKVLREGYEDRVPAFPRRAMPDWAVEALVDWSVLGGETVVTFRSERRESGAAAGCVAHGVNVVIDAEEQHPDEPRSEAGEFHWFACEPSLALDQSFGEIDGAEGSALVKCWAVVLDMLADDLEQIEASA